MYSAEVKYNFIPSSIWLPIYLNNYSPWKAANDRNINFVQVSMKV